MAAPAYIETTLAAALEAHPAVSAICQGRVYPLKIPQGTLLPAVVYQRIDTDPANTFQGYTSEDVIMTVASFAPTYKEAKALALAVRECMAEPPINAIFRNERDLFNNDADVFCIRAEYACRQSGGFCNG